MRRGGRIIGGLIIAIAAMFVTAELVARFVLGLGNPLLFEPSNEYGYRLKPNQDIVRFGNRITINAQGLRNGPVGETPGKGVLRILCLGDSTTNGGQRTDQRKTYPYLLQSILEQKNITCEVLNASAPGWAIPNEVNYVRKHGIYNSRLVVWLINDRDILEKQAGLDGMQTRREFPLRRPLFALAEAMEPVRAKFDNLLSKLSNLFSTRKKIGAREDPILSMRMDAIALGLLPADSKEIDPDRLRHILWMEHLRVFDDELAGLKFVAEHARNNGAKLIVVFLDTPAPERFMPGNEKGAAEMYKKAVIESGASYFDITESLKRAGYEKLFRDELHPNEEGNRVIAKTLADYIEGLIKK